MACLIDRGASYYGGLSSTMIEVLLNFYIAFYFIGVMIV